MWKLKHISNIEYQFYYLTIILVFMTLVQVSIKSINCNCVTCHNNIFNNNADNNATTHQAIEKYAPILPLVNVDDTSSNQLRSVDKLSDLSQLELHNVRTEFFKYKILDKLGLNDEPQIGARSPEFQRDFVTNFHINQETDNFKEDNGNEEIVYEADKLILTGRQNDGDNNKIEFDLRRSHLVSIINNKLSSIRLSIQLKKTPHSTFESSTINSSIPGTSSSSSSSAAAAAHIRLKLQQDIVRQDGTSSTTEILINNNKVRLLLNQNTDDNDITIKPINVVANTTTTSRFSVKKSQSLHEIELLPTIIETLKDDNNQIQLTLRDRVYEDLIIGKEDYRYKLVLFFPNNIQISSAYLSLINQGSETMFIRSKRSIDCASIKSNKSSCCRESFYVNFTDIGWDKWILHPPGYYANYYVSPNLDILGPRSPVTPESYA